MFWQAGCNSVTGRPLYHDSLPGARPLKFPPFAALVFQPLALFPLQVAAAFFSLLNRVLWVMAVGLIPHSGSRPSPLRSNAGGSRRVHAADQSGERTFDDAEGRQGRYDPRHS